MRARLGTNWHVALKDKIKTLRTELGLTQDQVAERSKGLLRRQGVLKLEKGRSQARSANMRKGLAFGFGATTQEIEELIDGGLAPEQLAAAIKGRAEVPAGERLPPEPISPSPSGSDQGSRKLNQLPQWPQLLRYAKILAPSVEEDVWEEVGETHLTLPRRLPTPRTLVKLAEMVIEDRQIAERPPLLASHDSKNV